MIGLYLMVGAAFMLLKSTWAAWLAKRARSRGEAVTLPNHHPVAYVFAIAVWPLETAVLAIKLAVLFASYCSVRLTERRLRKA